MSLGLVSPGAATDGVTPVFYSHRSLQSDDLFLAVVSSQLPPDLVCPVFFLNSATTFLFHSGVTPWRVLPTWGGWPPLPYPA